MGDNDTNNTSHGLPANLVGGRNLPPRYVEPVRVARPRTLGAVVSGLLLEFVVIPLAFGFGFLIAINAVAHINNWPPLIGPDAMPGLGLWIAIFIAILRFVFRPGEAR